MMNPGSIMLNPDGSIVIPPGWRISFNPDGSMMVDPLFYNPDGTPMENPVKYKIIKITEDMKS